MYDVLIIGAGPVGLAMARALQLRGLSVCLCGELQRNSLDTPDRRTAALFAGSIRLLEHIGAWHYLADDVYPLAGIRIVDATGHLLRAPEQLFKAIDLADAGNRYDDPRFGALLGFNVPNPTLTRALCSALGMGLDKNAGLPTVSACAGDNESTGSSPTCDINLAVQVSNVEIYPSHVAATLADGRTREGRVAIAADGRRSITRAAAGIAVREWNHRQSAITAHFEHTLPHNNISTEIHYRTGPCTVVPLGGNRSSLVWMDDPSAAAARAKLADADFIAALEAQLAGLLGPVISVTTRRLFPLTSLLADTFSANRVALIGEAGHAFPPIGAQGLNLGLRDLACLADHLGDAHAAGRDIGADSVLAAYSAERGADVRARTYGVDAFNQSLANRATGLLRGAVLHATKASPGFKRFLLDRGLEPIGPWPRLMAPKLDQ